MKTVLIVDDDLGFLFWLGHALGAAGYEPLPASTPADAHSLLQHFSLPLDLLIVNPALPRIVEFVESLRSSHTALKIIAAASAGDTRIGRVDAYCNKPAVPDEEAKSRWLEVVRHTLESRPAAP